MVDTNVLIHAADVDSAFHDRCRASLDAWRARSAIWFLTWPIVYEFLRVTTHPRVLRKPMPVLSAWKFMEAVMHSPGLVVLNATDRHADVAALTFSELPHMAGNLVHDLHTAILMREHGIRRIYTRDADFHRFAFVEAIDPVATEGHE